jgi:hypothetical protein
VRLLAGWLCCHGLACESAHADGQRPGAAVGGRKAEVTPELAAKSEQILRQHHNAPIGRQIPFRLNGRRYIARIEEHENASGEPGRPLGKHKGVTVYHAR